LASARRRLCLDLQPVDGGIVHFLVEELEAVPLRPSWRGTWRHRHSSSGLAIDAIGGIDGDTDARRGVQVEAADLVGTTNVENQLLGHEGNRRTVVDAGQHDHELVATGRATTSLSRTVSEAVRHSTVQLVADMMAQGCR
jgi:hypothetical protein